MREAPAKTVQLEANDDVQLGAAHVGLLNTARAKCSSLKNKRVSAHVLRHSTAMNLLQSGVDRSVIALWLGHESMDTTQIYLHASLELKESALARTTPFSERTFPSLGLRSTSGLEKFVNAVGRWERDDD